MRSFIIITVLSALAACYGAAVLPSGDENYTEDQVIQKYNRDDDVQNRITMLGEQKRYVESDDDLVFLHERRFLKNAVPDAIENVDILYYAPPSTVIKTILVTSSPPPSSVFPVWHLDNYISVRISSQRGCALNGTVRFYGTL
ncbi:uncharacterized protein LOC118277159 isoform X2 [Spodoptera frugiperda]|uniref:Uncharacterized protein LOC118277159 isoform X2 n=1 Tax=Spodoptera frugiperda TaxID=7108 RepID=A0A9R0DSV7_SPOFR|nr:uncharacterized protein LOC118277159 isoform X2 [Spodoptera frugiperda]